MGSCCVSDWQKIQKQKKKLRKKLEIESLAGGQDVMGSAMAKAEASPDHLVVMVNGIIGSASEWKFAAQQFVTLLPDKVIVHCSTCNPTHLTFDGVDLMGERLANEVLAVVNHWPGLQKISFIAHSLGGLVVRYAIGMLYEPLKRLEEEDSSHKLEKHEDYHKDRIAGLEPMNLITVATPHLGSRGHRQLPCLCGLHFLEWKFTKAAHLIAGRSGEHLFLTDIDKDKPPLLVRMASDSYELKFISALHSFKRRAAFANAHYDYIVGRSTSSIRRPCELPKGDLGFHKKYPHIVYIEPETFRDTDCRGSSNVENQMTDFEEEMIKGLNQVPWKRIHVSFRKGTQRWMTHSTIEVRSYWLNFDGADVIFHIIGNFSL